MILGSVRFKGPYAVPLISKDECIGVIVIDNFMGIESLYEEDARVLEAISIQATIAIINAQSHENEKIPAQGTGKKQYAS